MRILVRHVTRRGSQGTSFQDHECVGARITIGRGADQAIHLRNLRVTLAHAEILDGGDGQWRVVSTVPGGLRHNHVVTPAATLAVGDVLGIGPYELRVVAHPGHDFAVEVSEGESARGREYEDALYARSRLDLDAAGLRRRPWAVGLALTVAIFALVLPLLSALAPPVGKVLREVPGVPSDHAWLSGAVSQAHAHFADQCERCHAKAFVPTTNAACLTCHENTEHHVGPELLASGVFADAACSDCHHEHNGRLSIVRGDEGLCVSCHADLHDIAPATKLADATHFGSDHPSFEPLRAHESDAPGSNRAAPGLAFSHATHLREQGVENDAGQRRSLRCADCHVAEPGGGLMAPVRFEAHCHDCHRLRIPGEAERELPHGDVAATLASVRDYFAARALAGGYPHEFAPDVVRLRRRPGVELDEAERQSALTWAADMAAMTSREMIAYTTCGQCHQATPTGDGEWTLAPTGIPHAWLPRATFSHGQHDAMACADCHVGVANSDSSAELLLPRIEDCRTCHGGADAGAGRLASTCITCHAFHRATDARLAP
ncbi:MAG: cytochrome c3 family protein [Gammaproteobacteria bacterium]